MNKINVAFAGCGFLGLYQTGAVAALTHHGKSFLTSVERVSGSSAGSLNATMLVCNTPIDQSITSGLQVANKIRSNIYTIPWQNLDAELRTILDGALPEDAHKMATNKLFISVTCLKSPASVNNKLVSQFETRNDLINVLAQSCYIPLYSGFRVPKEGSGWAFDGSYTDNSPLFEDFLNIKVSPFAGSGSQVCPEKESLSKSSFEIVYKNTSFALTTDNIQRIIRVVIPSTNEGLKDLYLAGYRDCKLYLKKYGVFETAQPPDVLHLFDERKSTST